MATQDQFDFDDDDYEPEPPFQRHSDTSREAAEAIEPDAATLRGQVYQFIRERGIRGATDDEVQVELAMNPSTERPRRIELCKANLVFASNEKRPTRSGRAAVVWIVAEGGTYDRT